MTHSGNQSEKTPVLLNMNATRQEKFKVLVEAFSADLYRFAYWKCRDRSQAEDLIQETFLRAWKAVDSLRDADAAKAWLFMIFRREYARQFERKQHDYQDIEDMATIADTRPSSDISIDAFVLRRCLAKLSEQYREPLVLQVLGGFSCDEIGELMGLSRNAVMTRLFRARNKMRELLTNETPHRMGGIR